jgi:hypothetical protein
MNNLNPKFVKTFDILWQFEIRQDLEFCFYDWDSGDTRTCDVSKQASLFFAMQEQLCHLIRMANAFCRIF